jgi:pimeloyl-ACP methyl ester carboxylesterase
MALTALYVSETGPYDRSAIVLLHGLGMGHRMWEPQIEALSAEFHLLAPDLPGFGGSIAAGPFTVPGAARAVADLIAERTSAPAHVCGLSLGAVVALEMTLDDPTRVASLIL